MNATKTLTFLTTPATVTISVAIVVATLILCVMAWRRSGHRRSIAILESLRLASVIVVVLLFNQPEWVEEYRPEEKPTVAILWDASQSMETRDMTAAGNDANTLVTRRESIAPLVDEETWGPLRDRLSVVVQPIAEAQPGIGTDLHEPLSTAPDRYKNLTGLVVISDGDWNEGKAPVQAAARLRLMGVPVTGKNVFPSNIQGLPTWYEIRVSKDGYTGRTAEFDLIVALNAATYAKDVAEAKAGGWLLHDSTWPLDESLRRADVTYLGVTFGIQARKEGVVTPYKPAAWNDIPNGLKDPDGHWFTIHSGTLGFMVNVDALKGKPIPKSWADLLKPDYKGLVGYLDPASAFVGYVGAVAVNQARGGTLDNFGPGIDYFKALMKNDPIVPKQTSYARVLSGEIAILLDYDFNAYRAKYKDKANVEFVIPTEGTLVVPYVMSLVQKGPNAANGRKVLDFVLSDEGQGIWANAYLRPVRASACGACISVK